MNTLHLTISSVSENLFDGPVISATLPGAAGQMTILPHHEPLVSVLKAGIITVRINDTNEKSFPITSGVLEVSGTRGVVLV